MLELQLGFPSRQLPALVLLAAQLSRVSQHETLLALLKAGEVLFLSVKSISLNQLLTLPQLLQESLVLPGMLQSTGCGSRNSIFLHIFVCLAFLPSLREGDSCHQSHWDGWWPLGWAEVTSGAGLCELCLGSDGSKRLWLRAGNSQLGW